MKKIRYKKLMDYIYCHYSFNLGQKLEAEALVWDYVRNDSISSTYLDTRLEIIAGR